VDAQLEKPPPPSVTYPLYVQYAVYYLLDMQRKSKLAVLLLAGLAGLIGCLVVWILVPPSDPVKMALQSYTNGCAVIGIKNQTSAPFNYFALVERKIGGKWPEGWAIGTIIPDHQLGSLGAGQHTNLTIPVLLYAPSYPWRISVFCSRPAAPPNLARLRTAVWFSEHGLRKISHKLLAGDFTQIQVSTPEMEQREK
jgi:hypothetical protein